ncbi:substrate-binding periplasmic protein [Azospirillum griseum]|nr:transporter substrate-binding domain-containing protein [Azospirillum griseum]
MAVRAIALCLVAMFLSANALAQTVVRYNAPESNRDPRHEYPLAVLELALKKTEATDGPFRLQAVETNAPGPRLIDILEAGDTFDLLVASTSKERSDRLLAVNFPLDKGLLGYRVFLIRKEDAPLFAAVKTLDDLMKLSVGQVFSWADTQILAEAGFNVQRTTGYANSFSMLQAGRFAGFPRGANEAYAELESNGGEASGIMVEPTVALYYPLTRYFYVNKKNTVLADRLMRGLKAAQADGSFDALFNSHPQIKSVLDQVHFEKRKIFRIKNPILPDGVPLDNPALWFTPASAS